VGCAGGCCRLEGLSDAVFAFAVTLLVVSLEVPQTLDQLFGDAPANAIEPRQVPLLMLVYGVGFIAVQLVFILLYVHAYQLADSLELDIYERLTTRSELQGFVLNVAIGLASITIVLVGGPDAAFWSGMAYMLIMSLQILNGRVMGARIRQAATASSREPAT
jgi:Endosomal/lysosomal potassium channel TMEM175